MAKPLLNLCVENQPGPPFPSRLSHRGSGKRTGKGQERQDDYGLADIRMIVPENHAEEKKKAQAGKHSGYNVCRFNLYPMFTIALFSLYFPFVS
jgi:hypothetical protein